MHHRACSIFLISLVHCIGITFSSVNCSECAAPQQCVGNSNVQAVEDAQCAPCASGQTWWPCDIVNLCFCWNPSTPRVPPPPSSGLDFAAVEPCDLLTEAKFNTLTGGIHQAPYTYVGLCAAIDDYNRLHPTEHVFKMGTLEQQKAEIAAFLGNTLHESDAYKAPRENLPCGDFKVVNGTTYCKPCANEAFDWTTKQCSNSKVAAGGAFTSYCSSESAPPNACSCGPVMQADLSEELVGYMEADKAFFGRGALQLSWNYNYIRASAALTGDPDTFCANPDLVATEEKYAWGAGIFFWMEIMRSVQGSNGELSTCHIQAVSGDMGGTLWTINGNQECPATAGWRGHAVVRRINYYCRAATMMGVASLLAFDGCAGMKETFAGCDPSLTLSEGGCPDCAPWKPVCITGCSPYELHKGPGSDHCGETGMISESSSSGKDDCESRCTADPACKYISLWESGGANWCRLNSACAVLGQQPWHTINIYQKATSPYELHKGPGSDHCGESGMISESSSSGKGDCESRCTADPACKFISFWESGGVHWCRLNSACDVLGQQPWHTISIYQKPIASRLLSQAPSPSTSTTSEPDQDQEFPTMGPSPSPSLRR